MNGAHFTARFKDVIELRCNPSYDPDEWEQPYRSFTFDRIEYGKLPYVDDYRKIGLGTYPIFDENYRAILNGKIIDEYFNQEIGTETVDDFLLIIRRKMDQIMPYYNQLYVKIDYNPLSSMDIHSVGTDNLTGSQDSTATSDTETHTDSKSRAVNSDTPQTMLKGDEDYASAAVDSNGQSDVNANSTSTSNSSNTAENSRDSRVTGYQGSASDLVMKYRASLINIDTMIISNLADCFMLLLNNGDEYFARDNGWYF